MGETSLIDRFHELNIDDLLDYYCICNFKELIFKAVVKSIRTAKFIVLKNFLLAIATIIANVIFS